MDEATGYRRYSLDQVRLAQAIRILRSVQVPLEEVASLLEPANPGRIRKLLTHHRDRLTDRADELAEAIDEATFGIDFESEDHGEGVHYHATGGSFSFPEGLFLFTLWAYHDSWPQLRSGIEMFVTGVDEVHERAVRHGGGSRLRQSRPEPAMAHASCARRLSLTRSAELLD